MMLLLVTVLANIILLYDTKYMSPTTFLHGSYRKMNKGDILPASYSTQLIWNMHKKHYNELNSKEVKLLVTPPLRNCFPTLHKGQILPLWDSIIYIYILLFLEL